MNSLSKRVVLGVVSILVAGMVFGGTALALSNTGPRPGVDSSGNDPRYMLVKSDNTGDQSNLYLSLYSGVQPSSNITLTTKDAACGSDSGSCTSASDRNQYIEIRTASDNSYKNRLRNGDTTINKSYFTYDSSTGVYKADLHFILRNGNNSNTPKNFWRNMISFRLSASSGIYIGNSNRVAGQYVNVVAGNPNAARGTMHNYTMEMATPCNVTSGTDGTIVFVDLDSEYEHNSYKKVTISIKNITDNKDVTYSTSGSAGNGGTYYVTMKFQPNKKYKLSLNNIEAQNIIQYRLPYDSINYTIGCADWDISGQAKIKDNNKDGVDKDYKTGTITSAPGDTVSFQYTLKNNGPTPTSVDVYSNAHSWLSTEDPDKAGVDLDGGTISSGTAKDSGRTYGSSRDTKQGDVGKKICRRAQWSPVNSEGDKDARSNVVCVDVPYDYSLKPNTPSGMPDTAESTAVIPSVTASIDWTGPTKSKTAYWQLTMFIDKGANLNEHNSGTAPCGNSSTPNYNGNEYGSIGSTCTNLGRGTGVIDNDNTSLTASNVNIGELEVGTRVCFVMSVRARADDSEQWAHSAAKCLVISKKPKVQVLGGDLWVGSGASTGKVSTSITTRSGKTYGSYTEYGLIASGQVSGMASGSAYVGGSTTSNLCNGLSRLTLSNVNIDGTCSPTESVGRYTKTSSATALVDAVKARFSTTTDTPTLNGAVALSSKESGIYKAGATVRLSATTIGKGQWYVINAPTSTVVIEGDLQYTGDTLSSTADIPQVIIIANAIYIRDGVSRVDAWLVASNATATGLINTCDVTGKSRTSTSWINSTVCSTALTVNGPVVADQLLLRRTAGTGKDEESAGDPAEVFNFRPDAYLWLSGHFSDSYQPGTGYTRELPAKY